MSPDQLREKIDDLFTSCVGPPRAYFQVTQDVRVVYATVRVCMVGEPEMAGPVLCAWVYSMFYSLLQKEEREDRSHTLFWRSAPSIEGFINDKAQDCTMLRMRLEIPSLPRWREVLHVTRDGESAHWL